MPSQPIAIKSTGLVTSVGLSAPAACAAIRAKISNPTETRFIDSGGEWIMAHQVPLDKPWRGRTKLAKMAAMAITECLEGIAREHWTSIPLLLCVAERDRPGRLEGLDDQLFLDVQQELDAHFALQSGVIPHGRVAAAIALAQSRKLIHEGNHPLVLIAATDSLLTWPTLSVYERSDRLLTPRNSNGFMPGEGAGALLVGEPGGKGELLCAGVGFAMEKARIDSGEPLRADGLTMAIKAALTESDREMHTMHVRIVDLSGEQYYFKEAALALNRILRHRTEDFEIWHPADSCGESGAASGITCATVAHMATAKHYAPGDGRLLHFSNDSGARAAIAGIVG